MTSYGFIEVGTSDFASLTSMKEYKLQEGISVEPIKKLLDRLKNPPHHHKVCKCLSDKTGTTKFYKLKDEYLDIKANSGTKTDYERGMSCMVNTDNLNKRILQRLITLKLIQKDLMLICSLN
jgi:hypothetical protein